MAHHQIEFDEFARLVLDALEAAQLDYLIGGLLPCGHGAKRALPKISTWL